MSKKEYNAYKNGNISLPMHTLTINLFNKQNIHYVNLNINKNGSGLIKNPELHYGTYYMSSYQQTYTNINKVEFIDDSIVITEYYVHHYLNLETRQIETYKIGEPVKNIFKRKNIQSFY